jgi:hypothetical protein
MNVLDRLNSASGFGDTPSPFDLFVTPRNTRSSCTGTGHLPRGKSRQRSALDPEE